MRVPRELVEAMRPDGEIPGAAGEHGVGGQTAAEERDHFGEVEVAGQWPRLEVCEVVGACRLGPAAPARGLDGQQPAQTGRELREVGDDRQVGLVDAPQLTRVGMDVHERLAWPRHVEQRVAAGRDVAQPPADRNEQVGFLAPGERAQDPCRSSGGRRTRSSRCRRSPGSEMTRPPEWHSPRRRRPCPRLPARTSRPRRQPRAAARPTPAAPPAGAAPRRLAPAWDSRSARRRRRRSPRRAHPRAARATTGPGLPAVATENARATCSGIRAASSIWAAHFAMEPKTAG